MNSASSFRTPLRGSVRASRAKSSSSRLYRLVVFVLIASSLLYAAEIARLLYSRRGRVTSSFKDRIHEFKAHHSSLSDLTSKTSESVRSALSNIKARYASHAHDDDALVETHLAVVSKAGLIFSHSVVDVRERAKTSYVVALTKKPLFDVVVTVSDPDGCTSAKGAKVVLVFSTGVEDDNRWDLPRVVNVSPSASSQQASTPCVQGLIHSIESDDAEFDGLVARLFVETGAPDSAATRQSLRIAKLDEVRIALEEQLSKIQANRLREAEAEETDKSEEMNERDEASFEVEATPLQAMAPLDRSREFLDFSTLRQYQCEPSTLAETTLRCVLSAKTQEETFFYVKDPVEGPEEDGSNGFPVVVILAGLHGSEVASMVAAQHVVEHWPRPMRGRIVVVPRVNEHGMKLSTRWIPGAPKNQADLNRDFPLDWRTTSPKGNLANKVWTLMEHLHPDVLLDLHEGWGYYTQLKDNRHERLVGSKTFSKGSSVITTMEAKPIALKMVDKVNAEFTADKPEKKFETILRPVAGGLAARVAAAFGTRCLVLETTSKGQPVSLRAREHLVMVGAALTSIYSMPEDFNPLERRVAATVDEAFGKQRH